MSYYSAVNKEKPTEIEIGSEFVTIRKLDSYSAPKPCRILRRTTDADGTLVGLVLDRRVASYHNQPFTEHVTLANGKRGVQLWYAMGCIATELARSPWPRREGSYYTNESDE